MVCVLFLLFFAREGAAASASETHTHQYSAGVCVSCGYQCPHQSYLNGICMECGTTCPHGEWTEEGVCTKCWYQCPHAEHNVSGVCVLCGKNCQHILHNINGDCIACRKHVGHTYEHGACVICGKEFTYIKNFLDVFLLQPNGLEQGTVQSVVYTTRNYTLPEEEQVPIEKRYQVYLPYGYDTGKAYNVLFLCAGQNTDETYWFSGSGMYYYENETDTTYGVAVNDLLDNMIRKGICEPLIVVSVTEYLQGQYSGMDRDDDPVQFAEEFRRDILPDVISRFCTYASDCREETMVQARDHFGFYGASYGAFIAYESVMRRNMDLVSWYGCVSGFTTSAEDIYNGLVSAGTDQLPVRFLYTSSGDLEDSEITVSAFYRSLLDTIPGINELDSAYIVIPGAAHEGRVWGNGLYNCLQVFFTGV